MEQSGKVKLRVASSGRNAAQNTVSVCAACPNMAQRFRRKSHIPTAPDLKVHISFCSPPTLSAPTHAMACGPPHLQYKESDILPDKESGILPY